MRKKFLIFGSPFIEQPEIDEVVDSLRSGWIGTGPKVKVFENRTVSLPLSPKLSD